MRIVNRLLNNMTYHDPGNISTFAGVVVGRVRCRPGTCTPRPPRACGGGTMVGPPLCRWPDAQCDDGVASMPMTALSTWWNRWLDTYDAAMAIGHRVLRSPDGDPAPWPAR